MANHSEGMNGSKSTMETNQHKPTLMQIQFKLPTRILATIVIMVVLIAIVYFFKIPNPNMILIAGLVLCSALFGFGGGIIAAVIMLGYTLYFFSTDHCFTQFTPENIRKVVVSLIGIAADMLLVCSLKQAEIRAFKEIDDLSEQLRLENEHLKALSLIDPLTGIRNRLALRQDFDSYNTHEVTVMMIDIDNFKSINDTIGHEEGDRVLMETASIIAESFGKEYSYRYGGDEFLVVYPDASESEFKKKLDAMMRKRPSIIMDGVKTEIGISAGVIHEKLDDPKKLRNLFSIADERMYRTKRSHGLVMNK